MAEYIKREAVLEWFRPYTHEDILLEPVDVISEIRGIPAADAVEVVRCKDCKRCDRFYPEKRADEEAQEVYYCKLHRDDRRPDDFCPYGERKDNERN